jgi:hypothetical protein
LLPAGAIAGWGLHPLESAAFARRTLKSDIAACLKGAKRGILFYDPKVDGFGLVPWETVKKIDWERSSLKKML